MHSDDKQCERSSELMQEIVSLVSEWEVLSSEMKQIPSSIQKEMEDFVQRIQSIRVPELISKKRSRKRTSSTAIIPPEPTNSEPAIKSPSSDSRTYSKVLDPPPKQITDKRSNVQKVKRRQTVTGNGPTLANSDVAITLDRKLVPFLSKDISLSSLAGSKRKKRSKGTSSKSSQSHSTPVTPHSNNDESSVLPMRDQSETGKIKNKNKKNRKSNSSSSLTSLLELNEQQVEHEVLKINENTSKEGSSIPWELCDLVANTDDLGLLEFTQSDSNQNKKHNEVGSLSNHSGVDLHSLGDSLLLHAEPSDIPDFDVSDLQFDDFNVGEALTETSTLPPSTILAKNTQHQEAVNGIGNDNDNNNENSQSQNANECFDLSGLDMNGLQFELDDYHPSVSAPPRSKPKKKQNTKKQSAPPPSTSTCSSPPALSYDDFMAALSAPVPASKKIRLPSPKGDDLLRGIGLREDMNRKGMKKIKKRSITTGKKKGIYQMEVCAFYIFSSSSFLLMN